MNTKTYTFTGPYGRRHVELTIDVDLGMGCYVNSYDLRPEVYDRFVALANSGAYVVEILDSDYGVAWLMRRKEAA